MAARGSIKSHGMFRNSLELPLATQVSFELREHAEHIEEAFAGGGAGVDRLC